MAYFRKKPVVIEAEQATEPGTVKTLEGPMSYKAGDWLITGVEGEVYACKDSVFQKTYEPVSHNYMAIDRATYCTIPDEEIARWRKERYERRWYRRAWRWIKRMVGR